jgi:hypothetical protein
MSVRHQPVKAFSMSYLAFYNSWATLGFHTM